VVAEGAADAGAAGLSTGRLVARRFQEGRGGAESVVVCKRRRGLGGGQAEEAGDGKGAEEGEGNHGMYGKRRSGLKRR